jgi:glyoxylase-like metal-dependent hydrolase (beta-lactamase superfamily II)
MYGTITPSVASTTLGIGRRNFMQFAALAAGAATLPATAGIRRQAEPKVAAANEQGVGFHRFKIGDIEATIIHDGSSKLAPIQPSLAPEAKPDELRAVLTEFYHPLDAANIEFNVLALKIGAETVLIDTGNGGESGATAANLAAAGIKPESVTAIIISHAHADHIFGLVGAGDVPVFPNAKVFMSKIEHDFWTAPTLNLGDSAIPDEWRKAWAERVPKTIAAVKPKLNLVAGGDKLMDAVELIHTPGHTPGHLSIVVRSGNEQVMAMGDLAHNSVIMFAKPHWTIGFDVSKKDAIATRLKMFDRIASERIRILGYHMPWPGLGNIRRTGTESYQWLNEPWAW